jgi:hypothetical protein
MSSRQFAKSLARRIRFGPIFPYDYTFGIPHSRIHLHTEPISSAKLAAWLGWETNQTGFELKLIGCEVLENLNGLT